MIGYVPIFIHCHGCEILEILFIGFCAFVAGLIGIAVAEFIIRITQ